MAIENGTDHIELGRKLAGLAQDWKRSGLPPGGELDSLARGLESWKKAKHIPGLWPSSPPGMVTATIDDGMGHGLQVIHQWSEVMGIRVSFLGLLKSAEEIIGECRRLRPRLLGMTVLQFDTETDLIRICSNLPGETRFVAGGPVFKGDPKLANRAGIHFVAKDLSDFLMFVLENYPRMVPNGKGGDRSLQTG